jgi:FkbM family methyltransferase
VRVTERMASLAGKLRNVVLREAARLLVRSGTFRRHLGSFDPDFDPHFISAVTNIRNASADDAIFIRDLVSVEHAYAHIKQDLWVLHETQRKRSGYFVEFGATDGIEASNTCLLERDFGWTGILAEANPFWHEKLKRNRAAAIDRRCVFVRSGERIKFAATRHPGLATIAEFASCDGHAQARAEHQLIDVETVSLNDLLGSHGAPRRIDYMSIDMEGSELRILETFDFDRWAVGLFSIEHNMTATEGAMDELMSERGYERHFRRYTGIDAWYRRKSPLESET